MDFAEVFRKASHMDFSEKPPIGKYLEWLRNSYVPPISMRGAAELAGISEGRWRQIENGYRVAAKGLRVKSEAPPETIVQMVELLAASPDDLRRAGAGDAADLLERRQARMVQDIEQTSRDADLLIDIPDDMLAAEVVRRLLRGHPAFSQHGLNPSITTFIIRQMLQTRLLKSDEDRAEEARRRAEKNERETEPRFVRNESGVWEMPRFNPDAESLSAADETSSGEGATPPGQSEEGDL